MSLSTVIPVLRMFDEPKTLGFYVDFLGFRVDWKHRFEPDLPLYMQVSRGDCTIQLTQHFGDCCPGSSVRIATADLPGFHSQLAKDYGFARPGLEPTPHGMIEVRLTDPAGNRLTFFETVEEPAA